MFKKIVLTFFFVFLLWYIKAFDVPMPNENAIFVTDYADVFTSGQESSLQDYLYQIDQWKAFQIAVLTVSWLQDYEIRQFATELYDVKYQTWEKAWEKIWWVWYNDKWIFIIIAPNEREWTIEVGYWLEWTITDAIAKRIWEARFPPNFREWNYYSWIYEALQDINWYILKDTWILNTYDPYQPEDYSDYTSTSILSFWQVLVVYIWMSILFVTVILRKKK